MPLVPAEVVIVAGLKAKFPTAYVSTEVPSNLADVLPAHAVRRIGGADQVYPYDVAQVDVDTFGADAYAAAIAAEQVRSWFRTQIQGTTIAGAYVNAVETTLAPRWALWDNTNVRRYVASYRITLHSTTP